MIVCHSRKFIFIHLHKNGGTSVKDALQPHLTECDVLIGVGRKGQPVPKGSEGQICSLSKHSNARQIAKVLGREVWNSYFKFSFVRHPLGRLVSLYEFFGRVRRNSTVQPGLLKRMFGAGQTSVPVEDRSKPPWCWPGMQALLSTNDFAGFIRSEFLESEQGALPQARSLTDQSGELLVDFVGKVESISDDWQKLCTRLGVQAELPHVNRSEKRFEDVREYWTDDDLDFVAKKYREDFELFGYQLDETL